jgi:hypothetical protein
MSDLNNCWGSADTKKKKAGAFDPQTFLCSQCLFICQVRMTVVDKIGTSEDKDNTFSDVILMFFFFSETRGITSP